MKYPHIIINKKAASKLCDWTVDEMIEGFRAALMRVKNPKKGLRIVRREPEPGKWKSANEHIEELM